MRVDERQKEADVAAGGTAVNSTKSHPYKSVSDRKEQLGERTDSSFRSHSNPSFSVTNGPRVALPVGRCQLLSHNSTSKPTQDTGLKFHCRLFI